MKTLRRSPELTAALHTLKVDAATPFNRLHMFLYSVTIVGLIYHRSTSLTTSPLLFLAELQLAFMWATSQSFRWRPVHRREFPDRLIEAVGKQNLPGLDVFVCTADPEKEPPVGVVSTALSAMAFDYPADRISLYVSDDGGSELTLFAFMEAAKFARHWLPFCREKAMPQRSPEVYFSSEKGGASDEMKTPLLLRFLADMAGEESAESPTKSAPLFVDHRHTSHPFRLRSHPRQHADLAPSPMRTSSSLLLRTLLHLMTPPLPMPISSPWSSPLRHRDCYARGSTNAVP